MALLHITCGPPGFHGAPRARLGPPHDEMWEALRTAPIWVMLRDSLISEDLWGLETPWDAPTTGTIWLIGYF